MTYAAVLCNTLFINGFILITQVTALSLHNASYIYNTVVTAFNFIWLIKEQFIISF